MKLHDDHIHWISWALLLSIPIQVGIRLIYTICKIRELDLESNVKIYYQAKVFVTLFFLKLAHILMELMNLLLLLALK